MTGLTEDVVVHIAEGLGRGTAIQLDDFLRFGGGSLIAAKAHPESVRYALMLWSARAASTEISGVKIEGIQELVDSLRTLDPEAILERYDVQDGRALLTFYRDKATKHPVGYQFVNTPRPSHMDLLYEDMGIVLTPSQRGTEQPLSTGRIEPLMQRDGLDKSRTKKGARRA